MIAAVAIAVSSLSVVLNANRMRTFTPPSPPSHPPTGPIADGAEVGERSPTAGGLAVMGGVLGALWDVVYTTESLLWMVAWALVLGYAFSSAIQVLVKPTGAADRFGGGGVRDIGLATGLGVHLLVVLLRRAPQAAFARQVGVSSTIPAPDGAATPRWLRPGAPTYRHVP